MRKGMTCMVDFIGPRVLAQYLATVTELAAAELEEDIRFAPEDYYADYLDLCQKQNIPPVSPGFWADACRS